MDYFTLETTNKQTSVITFIYKCISAKYTYICSKYDHSHLTFTQSPLPEWIPYWAAMVTGIWHGLNPMNFDTKIPQANMAASDSWSGLKLTPQIDQHFPVTILTAIINILCVACRILPGGNAPFCLRLSDSDVVQHSSSRELPRATASLGLNTCDPEAVQLDLAMNLDQSQRPFPAAAVANANYLVRENRAFCSVNHGITCIIWIC